MQFEFFISKIFPATRMSGGPVTAIEARRAFLKAACAVAEGADVVDAARFARGTPAACVAVVLNDAERRICALGGRKGLPRSLATVHGGAVTRYLGGMRGDERLRFRVCEWDVGGMAVTRDGTAVLLTTKRARKAAIYKYRVADGERVQIAGCYGSGPEQFRDPCQLCVGADDFVFVADRENHRVQVLTPTLYFSGFIGVGVLTHPAGVCVTHDAIVAGQAKRPQISVCCRASGSLLWCFDIRFGFSTPVQLCWVPALRAAAVLDNREQLAAIVRVDGEFVRFVGGEYVQFLGHCYASRLPAYNAITCSDYGEIVLVGPKHCDVFDADDCHQAGRVRGLGRLRMACMHNGTLFALNEDNECVLYA
jgi:hypothetical protein